MTVLSIRTRVLSVQMPRRLVMTNGLLSLVLVGLLATGILGGTYPVSPADVVSVFLGTADTVTSMIVLENRLPRLMTALGVGLAFGLAGEMIQTLLRNPLASPDIIGFTSGAGLGAVLAVAYGGTVALVVPGALIGGALAAALLLALTWRQAVNPGVLVLVGIGITVTLGVITDLVMSRLDANNAAELIKWIAGSLNARSWYDAGTVWIGLLILAPLAFWHQFALSRLALSDPIAVSLGQNVTATRLITVALAVVLVALAVAAAGPLPFVAFVAGPIAHGLTRQPRPTLLSAALVGAVVTVLADRVAQNLPGLLSLPAGVFTALIGAPVLLWVLVLQSRKRVS